MFLYFVRGLRFGMRTMNFYARRFNLYLLLAAALALVSGCATGKKEDKQAAALRIHIESDTSMASNSKTVSVLRSEPMMISIVTDPILTEANVVAAKLLEAPGGADVEVKFDESGSWTLEQFSAANPGRHFVIFGQWGDKLANGRWLAAPSITRRNATGTLVFTADASREEVEKLVTGLNLAAKKNAEEKSK